MSDPIISTHRQPGTGDAAISRRAGQDNGRPRETPPGECPHRAGLRALARMIVQHAVAHPERFDALPVDGPVPPLFPASRTTDATPRAGDAG